MMVTSVSISAPDPRALAGFYSRLLGWPVTVSSFQPQEQVRVLFDPVGHPFCLFTDPAVVPAG